MRTEEIVGLALGGFILAVIGVWKAKTGADKERFRARISWPFWLVGIGRPTQEERDWASVGRKRGDIPPSLAQHQSSQSIAIEGAASRVARGKQPKS
jgi:hypothetical protein